MYYNTCYDENLEIGESYVLIINHNIHYIDETKVQNNIDFRIILNMNRV